MAEENNQNKNTEENKLSFLNSIGSKPKENLEEPSEIKPLSENPVEPKLEQALNQFVGEKVEENSFGVKPYSSTLKPLRTYQGDVDNAVSSTKASVVSIVVAEQKKKLTYTPDIDQAKSEDSGIKNKLYILIGLILFILGAVTLGSVYYFNYKTPEQKISSTNTIISYSDFVNLPIANTTHDTLIKNIIQKSKEFSKPVNSILYVNTTLNNRNASTTDLFAILTPNMPSELLRNITNEYMIGIYSFDINGPFIILKTDDYGLAFTGMLKWEGTMISDIGEIFNVPQILGTTTPYIFSDEALRNKDLRIIKDSNGKTILLYSIIDKNTIVITGTENIFNAIVSKYMTSKVVR